MTQRYIQKLNKTIVYNFFFEKKGRGDLNTTEGSPVPEKHKKTHLLKWDIFKI
jgi:hypothetical protein